MKAKENHALFHDHIVWSINGNLFIFCKIYLWFGNHLASTRFVCFLWSMKLPIPRTFTIFRTLLGCCRLTWTVTWTRFLSASRWVEADNDPNNSHIQPQQLSTGYRLYSLTMTICPGLEPIRRAASGEPCLVHRLQWNLPVSHPSRLVQGIYLTLHITFSQFKDLISHGKYFQWWLLYFT